MTDQADNISTVSDTGDDTPTGGFAEKLAKLKAERPEILVGGAFVGGVIVAMLLKRIANR